MDIAGFWRRVGDLMARRNLSFADLERMDESLKYHRFDAAKRRGTELSWSDTVALAEFLETTPEYLATGKGGEVRRQEAERRLLEAFHSLSPKYQDRVLEAALDYGLINENTAPQEQQEQAPAKEEERK